MDAARSLLVRYAVRLTLKTAGSTGDLVGPGPRGVKSGSSVRFRQAAPKGAGSCGRGDTACSMREGWSSNDRVRVRNSRAARWWV
jgi:hypothetical protein